jgi:hypothetical protein
MSETQFWQQMLMRETAAHRSKAPAPVTDEGPTSPRVRIGGAAARRITDSPVARRLASGAKALDDVSIAPEAHVLQHQELRNVAAKQLREAPRTIRKMAITGARNAATKSPNLLGGRPSGAPSFHADPMYPKNITSGIESAAGQLARAARTSAAKASAEAIGDLGSRVSGKAVNLAESIVKRALTSPPVFATPLADSDMPDNMRQFMDKMKAGRYTGPPGAARKRGK